MSCATKGSIRPRIRRGRRRCERPSRADRRAACRRLEKGQEVCAVEHDKVLAAGGLAVIGTERHESRRIDNQLRGRAGRQGESGPYPVLSLARRRPHASFRRQPHGFDRPPDGKDRRRRGCSHPGGHGHQGHRERAASGRGHAFLRPKKRLGIRRRHEPAA